ncbi:hypothetical protein AVEN_147537-1, partial [Araneus ventricosus]
VTTAQRTWSFLDRTCDRRNALENQLIATEEDRGAGGERHRRYHSIRTSSVCGSSTQFVLCAAISFEFSLGLLYSRIAILDETVRKRTPLCSATRWNFNSQTINKVYEYREQLIECMGKIESTSKQAVAINQAGAIRRKLEDSKFAFWLTAFHNIMQHVDVLYNQLQKTRTDTALIRKQVNVFQQSLEKERKGMDIVTKEMSASYGTSRKRSNIHINITVAAKEMCDVTP